MGNDNAKIPSDLSKNKIKEAAPRPKDVRVPILIKW
jgi:hypothetical protein